MQVPVCGTGRGLASDARSVLVLVLVVVVLLVVLPHPKKKNNNFDQNVDPKKSKKQTIQNKLATPDLTSNSASA